MPTEKLSPAREKRTERQHAGRGSGKKGKEGKKTDRLTKRKSKLSGLLSPFLVLKTFLDEVRFSDLGCCQPGLTPRIGEF